MTRELRCFLLLGLYACSEAMAGPAYDASAPSLAAGGSVSGNIDMGNNLVLNIGNSGTDFTSGGGLNIASDVAVATNKFNITASSGNTTIAGTLGVTGATTMSSTGSAVGFTVTSPGAFVVGNGGSTFNSSASFAGDARIPDDANIDWGTGLDFRIQYDTAQTPDSTLFGVGTDSEGIVICQKGDINFDFAHADQTNPTLWIHSANQSTSEWGSLAHDQTNFVIDAGGLGAVKIGKMANTAQTIAADDTTPSVDNGNVFTTSENSGATAITDLDDPTPGQIVVLCGGGTDDGDESTIADSGNFNLSAAMTLDPDDCITLLVQQDNDYIELSRVNN